MNPLRAYLIAAVAVLTACASSAARQAEPLPNAAGNRPNGSTDRLESAGDFLGAFIEGEKLYLEIPTALLGKDMLVYYELDRDEHVVRWERRGGRLLLLRPEVTYVAASNDPRNVTSRSGDLYPILATFRIEKEYPTGTVVVEATRLFTTPVTGFPGPSTPADVDRSFLEKVAVFPGNVEIDAVMTGSADAKTVQTRRVHWSLIRLPDQLMRPRLYDPRIGFWSESYLKEPRVDYNGFVRASIARWRLEKREPDAPLSEPIKPIVFYIDPATPQTWRPWVRRGVEAWQTAFEAAGFKNAIIAKEPPQDSSWSVDDARHSVVRWYARPQRGGGAMGTAHTVVDPRTGEILKANAYVGENFEQGRDWYFTMAAPLDLRAQKLPFPDSLTGAIYQTLVSHEVGHALGIRDGHYGGLSYPVDSLRSETWLRRMGFTASIINYTRFNHVAQPEDSIPAELHLASIGPADKYTIRWGYTPIPGARSPEEERPVLESWSQEQDTMPWLRFVPSAHELYVAHDASDDADPIRSTGLGVLNLRRVMKILPTATLGPASDNLLLQHLYEATLRQWQNEMQRVVALVGGFEVQRKSGGQPGPVYKRVSAAQQRAAVIFLDTMAFRTPAWLIQPEITRRFENQGAVPDVMKMQNALLARLLSTDRLDRMAEEEISAQLAGDAVYSRGMLLADLRNGLWRELQGNRVIVDDAMRRDLQGTYLMILTSPLKGLNAVSVTPYDIEYKRPARPTSYDVFRAEATELRRDIIRALPKTTDRLTRAHLELMLDLIERAVRAHPTTL